MLITTAVKIYIEYKNWGHYLAINPEYKPKPSEIFKSHMIGHSLSLLVPGGLGAAGKVFFILGVMALPVIDCELRFFRKIWYPYILLYQMVCALPHDRGESR